MSTLYVTEPPTDGKVILHTSKGEIEVELWAKEAPKAVRNLLTLALEGYYDACVWHRIVPGFCIQTGDPTGTGHGGESIYGSPFADEFHQRLRFNRRGLVAMANAGEANTNDSQFFITLDATPELQNKHTIFGRVGGTTIYNALALSEVELSTMEPDRPVFPPKLHRIEVVHNPFPDIVPRITREERAAQQQARQAAAARKSEPERERRKQKKNTSLLSFGEEEEAPVSTGPRKPMSSHDLLDDKTLSKQAIPARASSAESMPCSSTEPPVRPAERLAAPPAVESAQPVAAPEHPAGDARSAGLEKLQAAVKRRAQEAAEPPRPSKKTSQGRDLLRALSEQYQKKNVSTSRGASSREKSESDTIARLEKFRKDMRNGRHADDRASPTESARVKPSNTWQEEEEDMHDYGASDEEGGDNETDWRSHRFESGGVPLSGRKDQFSVQDYEVVDSRDTKNEMAASLGFGGAVSVRQQALRDEERRVKEQGRRGRDWT